MPIRDLAHTQHLSQKTQRSLTLRLSVSGATGTGIGVGAARSTSSDRASTVSRTAYHFVMHVKAVVSGIMTRAQGCVRDGNPTD